MARATPLSIDLRPIRDVTQGDSMWHAVEMAYDAVGISAKHYKLS